MSFNYMNAEHVSTIVSDDAVTGENYNWFRTPAVVDVSGMEFSYGLQTKTINAAASTSIFTMTVVDGSATGDAVATTAVLHATLTNATTQSTITWPDLTPETSNGTSATDLDVDDYVNVVTTTAGANATGLTIMASYIHGKPAGIAN